jgi:hypothetical protein
MERLAALEEFGRSLEGSGLSVDDLIQARRNTAAAELG